MKEEPPLRFRYPTEDGKHPNGREAKWCYGAYFPATDLMTTDMGMRRTGKPEWPGLEWIDNEQ